MLDNSPILCGPIMSLQAHERALGNLMCSQRTLFPVPKSGISRLVSLAHGPTPKNFCVWLLEFHGLSFQISAHLDIIWLVQKITWLSEFY